MHSQHVARPTAWHSFHGCWIHLSSSFLLFCSLILILRTVLVNITCRRQLLLLCTSWAVCCDFRPSYVHSAAAYSVPRFRSRRTVVHTENWLKVRRHGRRTARLGATSNDHRIILMLSALFSDTSESWSKGLTVHVDLWNWMPIVRSSRCGTKPNRRELMVRAACEGEDPCREIILPCSRDEFLINDHQNTRIISHKYHILTSVFYPKHGGGDNFCDKNWNI